MLPPFLNPPRGGMPENEFSIRPTLLYGVSVPVPVSCLSFSISFSNILRPRRPLGFGQTPDSRPITCVCSTVMTIVWDTDVCYARLATSVCLHLMKLYYFTLLMKPCLLCLHFRCLASTTRKLMLKCSHQPALQCWLLRDIFLNCSSFLIRCAGDVYIMF